MKDSKSQRSGKTSAKYCLLDTSELLGSGCLPRPSQDQASQHAKHGQGGVDEISPLTEKLLVSGGC